MLQKMKIGVRLGAGFGLVLVLMLILLATGMNAVRTVDDGLERIVKVNNAKIHNAHSTRESIYSGNTGDRGGIYAWPNQGPVEAWSSADRSVQELRKEERQA